MKSLALASAVAVLTVSGCATYENVEPPADPFAQAPAPVAPDLRLGAIIKDADVTYSFKGSFASAKEPLSKTMPRADALSRLAETLKENFKSVERVESAWEAQNKGVDLVVAVTVDYQQAGQRNQYDVFSVSLAFSDPKGAPIETISVQGKSMDFQDFGHGLNGGDTFAKSQERAMKFLALALRRSVNLPGYAANRHVAGPAPVSAAVPAAPRPEAAVAPRFRSDVEAPAYRLPENESKIAMVVGVEKYALLPAAEHAERDAASVKAHLLAAGYPERNIIFLTGASASKSGIEKYVDAWLPRNVDANSTVFFYFSGHGAPDIEKGEAYLMPADGDAKFVESTGYPVKRLYQKLGALKARRVLVAMDACFSGVGGRSVLAKGARPLVSKVDDGAAAAGRVVALTATAADEYTGTDPASGHGLFTYQFLKGLSAKGGRATMKELFDYVTPKVRDAARRDNRDQTPQLIGDGAASL
ncbi:MAG: caspase family protein [Elusimicrobiota bacterium]|nr:MAG: caspase family protein [Elusimicrobiota bacterium]